MKRFNCYTNADGDIFPKGAKWLVNDKEGSFAEIEPLPDQIGQLIPPGKLARMPTRYKRPNRKRGWMATVWAEAKRKAGWMDKVRGKFPDLTDDDKGE